MLQNKKDTDEWDFNQDVLYDQKISINEKVFHKKFGSGIVIIIDSETAEVAFKKYGIIVFKGFKFEPKKLTSFTDIFTKTYAADARRRAKRYGAKNITNVDYGYNQIDLHSEASFAPAWPEIIWYYCVTPTAGKGGATTLCDGVVLWQKLSSETKIF